MFHLEICFVAILNKICRCEQQSTWQIIYCSISSSPESSSETGAVAFSVGCITLVLACMLSSVSNRSNISCKLRVWGVLRLVKLFQLKKRKRYY
jgi:hypothetical protein